MHRLVVLVVLVIGCSKSKDKQPPPTPPPPAAAADAVSAPAADAADPNAGSAGSGSDSGSAAGSGSAAAGSGGDAGSGSAVASDFDFSKLSKEDKVKFMKTKVMPTMKPLFQKFDPKTFATVNCKTCHGKDPQGSKYKMPTPDLPPLDFDAIKAGKEDPKVVEFMSKTVKPQMAKLLNLPEMSETVKDGFGCLNCHTMKKKK